MKSKRLDLRCRRRCEQHVTLHYASGARPAEAPRKLAGGDDRRANVARSAFGRDVGKVLAPIGIAAVHCEIHREKFALALYTARLPDAPCSGIARLDRRRGRDGARRDVARFEQRCSRIPDRCRWPGPPPDRWSTRSARCPCGRRGRSRRTGPCRRWRPTRRPRAGAAARGRSDPPSGTGAPAPSAVSTRTRGAGAEAPHLWCAGRCGTGSDRASGRGRCAATGGMRGRWAIVGPSGWTVRMRST